MHLFFIIHPHFHYFSCRRHTKLEKWTEFSRGPRGLTRLYSVFIFQKFMRRIVVFMCKHYLCCAQYDRSACPLQKLQLLKAKD
jgi:hypothetical protein